MTITGVPTLNPAGFTNAAPGSFGARVPTQWPPQFYSFFTDFDKFNSALAATGLADWLRTVVEAGAGDSTALVSDAFGGVLTITTAGNEDDGVMVQWQGGMATSDVAETFKFTAGKELFFACRFQMSDVTQSDFICGLAIADTTPLDASDGVFFLKSDGSASLSLVSKIVTPVTASDALATLVADTWYEFGYHYNGVDAINAYQGGGTDGTWNFVGSVGITALPTTELAVTFGFQNGEAAAKTCLFDWISVTAER